MNSKNDNKTAFSLIELMVVIAIVAVIAFVAVPAYKQYSIKTKIISTFMPAIDKIKRDSIAYATAKGKFPNVAELGYPALAAPYEWIFVLGAATAINPLFTIDQSIVGGDTCGAYSGIQFSTTAASMGYTDGTAFTVNCYIYHVGSGSIDTGCFARTDATIGVPNLPYPFINTPYPVSSYNLRDGYYDSAAGVNRRGWLVHGVCQ